MSKDKRNIEFEEPREESKKSFSFRSIMDGNVLTQKSVIKQAPFLLVLVFLSLLMIANRNHAEKLVINASQMQKEVKELRSQSITTSSELMMMSRQSTVEQLVKDRGLGLKENRKPLKKLELDKENRKPLKKLELDKEK